METLLAVYFLVSSQPAWTMSCVKVIQRIFSGERTQRSLTVADKIVSESQGALREAGIKPINGYGTEARWSVDGVEYAKKDYELAFSDILSVMGIDSSTDYFENYLASAKAQGRKTNVADLFGSGFFIEHQNLADSITGVRFEPYARSELPTGYAAEKVPTEVLGDIINPVTWAHLDKSMHDRHIPSLNLVTMRPLGGWQQAPWNSTAELNIHALKYILGNVMRRLSSDGHFYFDLSIPQLPGRLSDHPLIQKLIQDIEADTRYKLVLYSKMSAIGTTYSLSGVLLPK